MRTLLIILPLFIFPSLSYGSSVHNPILRPAVKGDASTADATTDVLESSSTSRTGVTPLERSPPAFIRPVRAVIRFPLGLTVKLLNAIQELLTGGFLKTQTAPPIYGDPLGGNSSLTSEIRELAVQERSLLITESFRVWGTDGPFCKIKRVKLFSRKDRLRFYFGREHVATLRKVDGTDSYDVLRGKTEERIARLEKSAGSFLCYHCPEPSATSAETTTGKRKPIYTFKGDFISRRFAMKNSKNQCVAKIKKQLIAFPRFDHFVVRVAPGMDPILALACTCAIEQDLDEKLKERIRNLLKRKRNKKNTDE